MRKNTVAPKKPSATDAKLRASTSPLTGEDANLSPIKEETTEEDFFKLPEVQGSSDTKELTGDSLMEPLSDQQKDFFQSYLDDARNRMEEERREERKW